MKLRLTIISLLLFALSVSVFAAEAQQGITKILPTTSAPVGGDFTLESLKGSISTTDFRGRVLMLYFGYTQCPDVCPTSFSLMAQSLNELEPQELEQTADLFVSVDPKRDTVEHLAEYVDYFHPSFVGATGSKEAVDRAAELYGAQYSFTDDSNSAMGYIVNHSSVVYLIDKKGVLRYVFPHATPPETMLGGIRRLLEES